VCAGVCVSLYVCLHVYACVCLHVCACVCVEAAVKQSLTTHLRDPTGDVLIFMGGARVCVCMCAF